MRKILLRIIFLTFLLPLAARGQNIHLTHNDYTIQLPEGRVNFTFNEKKIAISFNSNFSEDAIIQYFKTSGLFEPYAKEWKRPHPVMYFAVLKDGQNYNEALAALNANANVAYVAPVLLYGKEEQALYDVLTVKLKADADIAELRTLGQQFNFAVEGQFQNMKNVYVCRINKNSAGNTLEIAKHLQSLNKFAWAEPDFIYTLQLHTSDPFFTSQWGINNTGQYTGATAGADMEVVNAWGIVTGNSGISVAIHDCWGSAAEFIHPDVSFAATFDATGSGFSSSTFSGDAHGINCAGIISATGNNSLGAVGVAYGVQLKAVKIGTIINSGGSFSTSGLIRANATIWSYQNADIVSNSTGGGSSSSVFDQAIADALVFGRSNAGTLFCSSSGNSNTTTIGYPSSNTNTIAVGATSFCDVRKAPSSCSDGEGWGCDYGTGLDVGAPGIRWYSTDIVGSNGYTGNDYYAFFNGTSSACPAAAGVLALLYSNNPTLSAANARWALETTCEKVGGYTYTAGVSGQPNGTWTSQMGYGRVNAYQAVQAVNCTGATNDNCANAIPLPLNASCTYTNGNLCRATQSIAPSLCSGFTANRAADVWYTVTPSGTSGTGVTLTCVSGANTDVVLGIYSGSCGGLTLVQCVDATTLGGTETMTVTGLTSGQTYYVRVYDWDGSTLNTGFQICATQCGPTTPTVTPAGPVSLCSGNTQTLTISNPCVGCSFAWSGGGTGTTNVISTTSTTTVTATNSCGTSVASNSVAVTVNPVPVVPIVTPVGPVAICGTGSQTLTISNPCSGCTFNWSNGGTGTTQSINTAGNYTVTATNSCGTSIASNSVAISVTPNPVVPTVTPAGPVSICAGNSQTLTISNPCTGCTFNWSNGGSGTTQSINTAGNYTVTSTNSCGTSTASNSVAVTVNPLPVVPTVTPAGPVAICGTGSQTLTISNPCVGCTFNWSNGGTGTTQSINTAGNYTATSTNSCGTSAASNSVAITVTPNPVVPTVTPAGPVNICTGNSQTLTISNPCSGCTFNWSNGGTGTTQSINTAGNYTATSTNMCGTSAASNSVAVTILPLPVTPVVTPAGPLAICSVSPATLTVSNPCTGCTFDWSNSDVGITTSINTTGTYTATSTNTCGTSSASNAVTVNVTPQPNNPTGITASPTAICTGNSSTLTVNGTLSTGATWVWRTGSCNGTQIGTGTSISVSPTVNTTYYVRAENGICNSNCSNVTITVNPLPVANAGTNQAICSGSSVQIGSPFTTGNTYSWLPVTGLNNANFSQPTASPLITTTYTLTRTNSFGCQDTAQVTVTVNSLPTANAGPNELMCSGYPTTIGTPLVPGYAYSWAPATDLNSTTAAMPVTTATSPITYTLTVTNIGTTCVSTDAVSITINPVPDADAGPTVVMAPGFGSTIGGSPTGTGLNPITYSWAPAVDLNNATLANPFANPPVTTVYTVTVTDGNGCPKTDTMTFVVLPPCVDPIAGFYASQTSGMCPLNVDFIDTSHTSGPATYEWTIQVDGGAPFISNAQAPSILYLTEGSFAVQLIITDSCGTDTMLMQNYINVTCPLSTASSAISNRIDIFPNPTTDIVNINAEGLLNGTYSIMVQNVLGQTLHSRTVKVVSGAIEEKISLAPYAVGVYTLQINGSSLHLSRKVEKKN